MLSLTGLWEKNFSSFVCNEGKTVNVKPGKDECLFFEIKP